MTNNNQWQQVVSDPFVAEGSSAALPSVQIPLDKPLQGQNHYMHLLRKRVTTPPLNIPDTKPPSTPIELFDRARQLIANDGWVQGKYAINAKGESVPPASEDAVQWCILGSWMAVCEHEPDSDYMFKYMNTVWNCANPGAMVSTSSGLPYEINDKANTPLEKVVRFFDKTINFIMQHPEFNNPRRK